MAQDMYNRSMRIEPVISNKPRDGPQVSRSERQDEPDYVQYQKEAYWHIVEIAFNLQHIIGTKSFVRICAWARRRTEYLTRLTYRSAPGDVPCTARDVEEDELLKLLTQRPCLIVQANRYLTVSRAQKLASRFTADSAALSSGSVSKKGWNNAVRWAEGIIVQKEKKPKFNLNPLRVKDTKSRQRLSFPEYLSQGMGMDFVRHVATFIIQVDRFAEVCHNTPPGNPVPRFKKKHLGESPSRYTRETLGQKQQEQTVELDGEVVKWAEHWMGFIAHRWTSGNAAVDNIMDDIADRAEMRRVYQ